MTVTSKPRLNGLIAVFLILAVITFAATGIAGLYVANQARDRATQNSDLIQRVENQAKRNGSILSVVRENAAAFADCNTPGGKCYNSQQERTAKAVANVNNATLRTLVHAFVCNDRKGGGRVVTLTRCVEALTRTGPGNR